MKILIKKFNMYKELLNEAIELFKYFVLKIFGFLDFFN